MHQFYSVLRFMNINLCSSLYISCAKYNRVEISTSTSKKIQCCNKGRYRVLRVLKYKFLVYEAFFLDYKQLDGSKGFCINETLQRLRKLLGKLKKGGFYNCYQLTRWWCIQKRTNMQGTNVQLIDAIVRINTALKKYSWS